MNCVDLVEITSFKSSGNICWSPAFFTSFDELSVNKRDSDGFFSRRIVGRSSDRSYSSTDSSLNILNCQLAWLGFSTLCVLILLTKHTRMWSCNYVIACNIVTTTFLWLTGCSRSSLYLASAFACTVYRALPATMLLPWKATAARQGFSTIVLHYHI